MKVFYNFPPVTKWYKARSYLLGLNYRELDISYGYTLALECRNDPGCEEAEWFCSLIERYNGVTTIESSKDVVAILTAEMNRTGKVDGRSLFFIEIMIGETWNVDAFKKAASLGYPYAMSCYAANCLCNYNDKVTGLDWAKRAALAGDPRGMYLYSKHTNEEKLV
jgi:hypothetical protein